MQYTLTDVTIFDMTRKETQKRRILTFMTQVVVTTLVMAALLWLFDIIFHESVAFDWGVLLQAFIFAIIYVPLASWSPWRK